MPQQFTKKSFLCLWTHYRLRPHKSYTQKTASSRMHFIVSQRVWRLNIVRRPQQCVSNAITVIIKKNKITVQKALHLLHITNPTAKRNHLQCIFFIIFHSLYVGEANVKSPCTNHPLSDLAVLAAELNNMQINYIWIVLTEICDFKTDYFSGNSISLHFNKNKIK